MCFVLCVVGRERAFVLDVWEGGGGRRVAMEESVERVETGARLQKARDLSVCCCGCVCQIDNRHTSLLLPAITELQ